MNQNSYSNTFFQNNIDSLIELIHNYITESNYNDSEINDFLDKLCLYFTNNVNIPEDIESFLEPIKNNQNLTLYHKLYIIVQIIGAFRQTIELRAYMSQNNVNRLLGQNQVTHTIYPQNHFNEDPTNHNNLNPQGGRRKIRKTRKNRNIRKH
jgi:hypothetical protein